MNISPQEMIEGATLKEEYAFKEGQMILGEQLENPYSVENMQRAYDSLQVQNKLKTGLKIETTHLYVRFRPKSDKELNLITRDTILEIYDYPLDVKIKRGGTHYHDPSVPANEITWQYTVVPVDYTFPKVQYQKLADLYLPEESNELTEVKSATTDYFNWLKLETEALRITGNLNTTDTNGNKLKSSSWRPQGTIKVWDDIITTTYYTGQWIFSHYNYYNGFNDETITLLEDEIDSHTYAEDILPQLPTYLADYIEEIFEEEDPYNHYEEGDILEEIIEDSREAVYNYQSSSTISSYMPLEGVKVRARRWFTTHTGITNSKGEFTCDGTFTRPANYSIKWERNDFDIRDGSYGQAYFNGPKVAGDWNLIIQDTPASPKSFLFAHIFRAAYTYYYKHTQWGIKAPPKRDGIFDFLTQRLHIAGKDKTGRSKYLDIRHLWQMAEISVFRNSYNSQEIFGTTIHELAHASHWEIGYSSPQYAVDWVFDSPYLPESWAVGVETVITRDVYNSNNYNWQYQMLYISQMDDGYTCIVEDLMDTINQGGTNPNYPNDQVSGYTLAQIEDALPNDFGSWWVWRTNLKEMYSNPTEQHLDALFQSIKQ